MISLEASLVRDENCDPAQGKKRELYIFVIDRLQEKLSAEGNLSLETEQ